MFEEHAEGVSPKFGSRDPAICGDRRLVVRDAPDIDRLVSCAVAADEVEIRRKMEDRGDTAAILFFDLRKRQPYGGNVRQVAGNAGAGGGIR